MPIPTYKPPSQTQLAFRLAKDVLNDFIPAQYQPIVLGVVGVVVPDGTDRSPAGRGVQTSLREAISCS